MQVPNRVRERLKGVIDHSVGVSQPGNVFNVVL